MENLSQLQRREKIAKYIKIVVAGVGGVTLATLLGLEHAVTAGTLGILSLQSTKRETFRLALWRLGGLVVAFVLAYAIFSLVGYTLWGYALFLALFALFCILTDLESSITTHSVLVGQIMLIGRMDWRLIANQGLLFFIGAGLGILLNLYITTQPKDIHNIQETVDHSIREVIYQMAEFLRGKTTRKSLEEGLGTAQKATEAAYHHAKKLEQNFLTSDYSYYPGYLMFRRNQIMLLEDFLHYQPHPLVQTEELLLAEYIQQVAQGFHECNDGSILLAQAEELLERFRQRTLPTTREEFEQRAVLYGLLSDIISLIRLKESFVHSLTAEQMGQFFIYCQVPTGLLQQK